MTRSRRARLASAALAAALAACTATSSSPPTPSPPSAGVDAGPSTSPGPAASSPSPSPSVDPVEEARALLGDVEAAASASADALRRAVTTLLDGELGAMVAPSWEAAVREGLPGWPVTVGQATVTRVGTVSLDVVLAAPAQDDGQLVLRWLASAAALGDAVTDLAVHAGGRPVEVEVDADGARLLVPVPAGQDQVLRVTGTYTVPERAAIADDGSPAGYGLLARTDGAVMLGHWLPLVTLESDDGPMQARGDVGAFPAGAFWVEVEHDGTLVTGGEERPCPDDPGGCTLARGVGIRDLSAVLLDVTTTSTSGAAAVHVPGGLDLATGPVAEESARMLEVLTGHLGPLPWPSVDVVAVPLEPGALGMEFPGVVWVDPGAWPGSGPELGSYVLAHELAHQWFHALVGNGSLTAPVVDESIAQYLSVVVFDEVFGEGAGAALAGRSLGGRHARALADGLPDEAPAQPLDAFASARSYGANVYGRGGQAWVDAEAVAGRGAVLDALRALVERSGLREVDHRTVLDVVGGIAPEAASTLAGGWGASLD